MIQRSNAALQPRAIMRQWPDGRKRYYANIHQCWTDAYRGNLPIHEHGAHLELVADDGSPDWDALQTRAQSGPVFLHA